MSIVGDLYGLGAALGLASYFASVGNKNAASSVGFASQHATALQNAGVNVNQPNDPLAGLAGGEKAIIDARNTYAMRLKAMPHHLDAIYEFGLAIGIAEGELSVGSDAANNVAHTWLSTALTLAAQLHATFSFVNPSLFNVNSNYATITGLRQQFQADFNNFQAQ
jgi:hypothetical protein